MRIRRPCLLVLALSCWNCRSRQAGNDGAPDCSAPCLAVAGLREVCYRAKAGAFPGQMIAGLQAAVCITSCKRASFCWVSVSWLLHLSGSGTRGRGRRRRVTAGASRGRSDAAGFRRHVMGPVHACRYAWSSTLGGLPGSFRLPNIRQPRVPEIPSSRGRRFPAWYEGAAVDGS
jgi:hypothetical protein